MPSYFCITCQGHVTDALTLLQDVTRTENQWVGTALVPADYDSDTINQVGPKESGPIASRQLAGSKHGKWGVKSGPRAQSSSTVI